MVRIVTVDELLQAYSLRAVDILKVRLSVFGTIRVNRPHGAHGANGCWRATNCLQIDTEGYDMAALLGAAASLKAGIISVVVFEYHAVGLWTSHSLHEAVSWLRSMRYICYFDGRVDAQTCLYSTTPTGYQIGSCTPSCSLQSTCPQNRKGVGARFPSEADRLLA